MRVSNRAVQTHMSGKWNNSMGGMGRAHVSPVVVGHAFRRTMAPRAARARPGAQRFLRAHQCLRCAPRHRAGAKRHRHDRRRERTFPSCRPRRHAPAFGDPAARVPAHPASDRAPCLARIFCCAIAIPASIVEKSWPSGELTLDHVIPRSRGGASTWENLVACCHPCNRRKGNQFPARSRNETHARAPRLQSPHQPPHHAPDGPLR